jgi:hypothetical protein
MFINFGFAAIHLRSDELCRFIANTFFAIEFARANRFLLLFFSRGELSREICSLSKLCYFLRGRRARCISI